MNKKFRIAIGQISSESNHFVSASCDLDFFRTTGYLREGEEVFGLAPTDTEVGGMLAVFAASEEVEVEVVPLLAARANSSGPLSASCYAYLKGGLLTRLQQAGPVDGVILSHHGSMAAVGEDDPEGDIAQAVRAIFGPDQPLALTLDLHGNVTARMAEAADIIVGYEHYPHDDVRTTGERAAALLLRALRGEIRPVTALAKLPLLLTAFNASTLGNGPFARLMDQAKALEQTPGILSASMFFVGSYIDVPEIGCSSVVVADGDAGLALRQAQQLAQQFWERRKDFVIETLSVARAVEQGRQIEGGPILLLDTADTTGGGACGDGIGLVRGLLEAGVSEPCLAMVVDPQAAARCHQAAQGEELVLDLGHHLDPRWGKPLRTRARVLRKSDGRFSYTGGILGGTWASMGPSTVLELGPIHLLVSSVPTYDWAFEQYASLDLDPRQAKFVGVKNMMNFRTGYRDLMKGFFVLDLPGPTPADMRALPFRRVDRPLFPFDQDLENPRIRTATSARGKGGL